MSNNNFFGSVTSRNLKQPDSIRKDYEKGTPHLSKNIMDISVDLIEPDEINEQLFGYEDLDKIEKSFEDIGNKSIIYVYDKGDGTYVCFSGSQRLLASKARGEKKITCCIDGKLPSEDKRIEDLISMNSQRKPRPLYIAMQLKVYESVLRKQHVGDIPHVIEEKFGYKWRMQYLYKQILTLPESLQTLFKRDDVPTAALLKACTSIPEGKEQEFIDTFERLAEKTPPSEELVKDAFQSLLPDKDTKIKPVKISNSFKKLLSISYSDDEIVVKDKDKETVKEQAVELKEYLDKVIAACE